MAKKLKVVQGVAPSRLIAKQVIPIQMIDGQTGLAMVSEGGIVYTYTGTGWVKLSMVEVADDTKV
jgi:hypothetical protein